MQWHLRQAIWFLLRRSAGYREHQRQRRLTSFNKLLYAYRLYAFVKDCNLAVYINEIELDRARLKVQSIEKDLLPTVSDPVPDAWVKTFFHGDTLDTVALFSEAVDSYAGCQLILADAT